MPSLKPFGKKLYIPFLGFFLHLYRISFALLKTSSGSTFIELPVKLTNLMKGLMSIKNTDNTCFLWCHIRHLNPLKRHPQRIRKADKNMVNDLDYEFIKFPVSKRDKIQDSTKKTVFALMYFVMKIIWFILFMINNLKTVWIYC